MNSFDGTLTILGILIATFLAQLLEPAIIIVSSLGVIVSTGVSGIWGGYMAERAEKKKARRELEKHLMKNLSKTKIEREMKKIAWFMGLANGLSSTIVSVIAIIPFFLATANIISVLTAFVFSFILIFAMIFLLGVFIGKIARESILFHGSAMIAVGIIVGIILYFFEFIKLI